MSPPLVNYGRWTIRCNRPASVTRSMLIIVQPRIPILCVPTAELAASRIVRERRYVGTGFAGFSFRVRGDTYQISRDKRDHFLAAFLVMILIYLKYPDVKYRISIRSRTLQLLSD